MDSAKIYYPEKINEVINKARKQFEIVRKKNICWYNIPAAFDIETSSFYDRDEKRAIMYEWTFGICGYVVIGRTWEQFLKMIKYIIKRMKINPERRLIIYVHNLGYEFQFIRKLFKWGNVFSVETRKPVYAITTDGVEFRCSYILSGYSLGKLADNLQSHKIKKLTGDLDYTLIRHHQTPMTIDEMSYCINDVLIVMYYIDECIEESGNITKIPLTKTGYVREYCRDMCFNEPGLKKSFKRVRYRDHIKNLTLTSDEYSHLKRAFQGGFTHANPFCSNKVMFDVSSFDFTSSYPAVMLSEQFPMSASEYIENIDSKTFIESIKYYCCLFDIELTDVTSSVLYESYISSYRCFRLDGAVINNGRVVSADRLVTTVTEQDFLIMRKFYKWKTIRVGAFRRYKRGYLPRDFCRAILQLYQNKTTLKGVEGMEAEYLKSKEMINSCYGMCVTDIVRDEIIYDDEWSINEPDIDDMIKKYNNNQNRFLFYPWGVWVTAYARRNLFTGIIECAEDYVYSDTDSIKCINAKNHKKYFDDYNSNIINKLYKAMDFHGFDRDLITPETIKGIKKPLGVWDYEGTYSRFKTLGAKRYMTETDGKISLTVAGLNKKITVPYLCDIYDDPFIEFNDDMFIPADFTGKNTHTYLDTEQSGTVTDYTGKEATYHEMSSVHLEKAEYSMSLADEYIDYIISIGEEYL